MTKGMLMVISGPSGSGKGTVVKLLEPDHDFALSTSVTTRPKRSDEIEGIDYFFKTEEEFIKMRDSDQLLEHASFVGNMYGTPRFFVEEQILKGKTVVLEIEVLGALQIRRKFHDSVLVFLMPPSFQELKNRLIKRGTESTETIENRLRRAAEEIKLIDQYDYLVINDSIKDAANAIKTIVNAEKLKPKRNKDIIFSYYGAEGHINA